MNNRNFYLLKGDWYKKLTEITGLINKQSITVWTPRNRSKNYHLLVVHGAELPEDYCFQNTIWKTDDTVFESFYQQKANKYYVHVNYHLTDEVRESRESFAERREARA